MGYLIHSSFLQTRIRNTLNLAALFLILLGTSCASRADDDLSRDTLELTDPGALEPVQQGGGDPLEIVASTSIIADIATNIGGGRAEVSELMPRGTDPHAYQPTPGDLQMLYQADLILLNGLELEFELEDILAPISLEVPVVALSTEQQARSLEEHSDEDHDAHEGELDPHIWFDPLLVVAWVDRIETAFIRLDPTSADEYQERASTYRTQLLSLDEWIQGQVDPIPVDRRILVLDHLVLGYFGDRYGFEMGGALAPAFSSLAQASPRELSELSETIRREGIEVIFIGVGTNSRLAEQIAADAGIEVIELYTGSLGPANGPAGTYLDMMQYNVIAITQALVP